jgi:hypothetical protein
MSWIRNTGIGAILEHSTNPERLFGVKNHENTSDQKSHTWAPLKMHKAFIISIKGRVSRVPDGHFHDLEAGAVDLLDEAEDGRQHVRILRCVLLI